MKRTDRTRFGLAIAVMAETFDKDVREGMVEGYFAALEDLSIEAVENACRVACRESEFFPRPVQLRRIAKPPANARLLATEAWEQMISVGYGQSGALSVDCKDHPTDEIANKALELLGPMDKAFDWEGPWALKRFVENYELLFDRKTSGDLQQLEAPTLRGLLTDG